MVAVASIAIRFHWPNILKEILPKCKIYPKKFQNYLGQTLIHIACRNDDFEMMKCLANCGQSYDLSEDINLLDCVDELTPLQFACKKNDQNLFRYLLKLHGCFADTKNKDGNTVLHICSILNVKEMAELCLPYCSKTIRNEQDNTPLHLACHEKNFDLLNQLVKSLPEDRKIDSCVKKEGENVLHVIAAQKSPVKSNSYASYSNH